MGICPNLKNQRLIAPPMRLREHRFHCICHLSLEKILNTRLNMDPLVDTDYNRDHYSAVQSNIQDGGAFVEKDAEKQEV